MKNTIYRTFRSIDRKMAYFAIWFYCIFSWFNKKKRFIFKIIKLNVLDFDVHFILMKMKILFTKLPTC